LIVAGVKRLAARGAARRCLRARAIFVKEAENGWAREVSVPVMVATSPRYILISLPHRHTRNPARVWDFTFSDTSRTRMAGITVAFL
jgi:hypothetical protein